MYPTILLAYDGSVEGRRALREGGELAALCRSQVHLVAVVVPTPGVVLAEVVIQTEEEIARELAEVRAGLEEGAQWLQDRGLAVQTHLRAGQPAEEIGTVAREVGANLVVVGHREQGVLARWWRGSVGQSLLAYAPCSILVSVADREDAA